MDLTLSESLYAYDLLLKQGKLLISEMASRDVDEEDTSIMKAFGYQYYYYYLYYYFNNIRRTRLSVSNLSHSNTSSLRISSSDLNEDIDTIQNNFHSTLMESVYVGQFCDVIPRESSLAPVKLFLGGKKNTSKNSQNKNFAFIWNMFDSIKSIKIFTKVLCKDYNIPFDERLSMEFEKQVLEASIVECDFALLVEFLAIEQYSRSYRSETIDQIFKKKIKLDITPEKVTKKIYENIIWDLLDSDTEAIEIVKRLIYKYGVDENQIGTIMYYFKKDIMNKKRELVISNSERLYKYSIKYKLRTPFIYRRKAENIVDNGPFLLSQKLGTIPEIDENFRISYKERLKILTKISNS